MHFVLGVCLDCIMTRMRNVACHKPGISSMSLMGPCDVVLLTDGLLRGGRSVCAGASDARAVYHGLSDASVPLDRLDSGSFIPLSLLLVGTYLLDPIQIAGSFSRYLYI